MASPSEFSDYLSRVRPTIDATITKLSKARFREDPIAGRELSRITSIVSSAYKRHSQILKDAFLERLYDNPNFEVWLEKEFKLSAESRRQMDLHDDDRKLVTIQLPYGSKDRTITLDAVVADKRKGTLCAYLMHRGNGHYDAVKSRAIRSDLLRCSMHLQNYGEKLGHSNVVTSAYSIFYYGVRSLNGEISFTGDELDEHFGFQIRPAMECANQYFHEKLLELIHDSPSDTAGD